MPQVKRTSRGSRVVTKGQRQRAKNRLTASSSRAKGKKTTEGKTRLYAILKKKDRKKSTSFVEIAAAGEKTGPERTRRLRFGTVTVSNTVPDAPTLQANVKAGRDALVRVMGAFTTSGVKLRHKSHVPIFRVDARNPHILIREVDGRMERGSIVDGSFVPAA